jgi:serine/threonine protein kinase
MSIIKILYNNRDQTIKLLDTHQSIVRYLGVPNNVCPLISSNDIKIVSLIGTGEQGAVFSIEIAGMSGRYAVKQTPVNNEKCIITHPEKLETFIDRMSKKYNIIPELMLIVNGGDPNKMLTKNTIAFVPFFGKECLGIDKPIIFENNSDGTIITVPEKSYVCMNTYTEYLISLLVSKFYREKECINFIDTFAFATCESDKYNYKQYTFMQQIDSSLQTLQQQQKIEDIDNIIVQLLFAISLYQKLKISHNDLHTGNIFIEYTDKMIWNGKKVSDYDYLEYRIGSKRLFIKRGKYIVKIGDWGLACKYSEPMILQFSVMEAEYEVFIPNFYDSSYDVVYALGYIRSYYPDSELLMNIGTIIDFDNVTSSSSLRPLVDKVDETQDISAEYILDNEFIMRDYLVKPTSKNILLVGEN